MGWYYLIVFFMGAFIGFGICACIRVGSEAEKRCSKKH